MLERRTYEWLFNEGDDDGVLRAIVSYQNADGGFGHGIEPDLLTPSSTMVAAETALVLMDLIGVDEKHIPEGIANWLAHSVCDRGTVPNPPENLKDYPHQPWWENHDDSRVLMLAGMLAKTETPLQEDVDKKIRAFANAEARRFVESEEPMSFYAYPLYVYALHTADFAERHAVLHKVETILPFFLDEYSGHHPLFSRYWYHCLDRVPEELIEKQIKNLQKDLAVGILTNPYPDLPWWEHIFTLDALVVAHKYGYV